MLIDNFKDNALFLKDKIKHHIQVLFNAVYISQPSRMPVDLVEHTRLRCVLSGSSISSLYHDEPVNDYDFWFKTPEDANFSAKIFPTRYSDFIADYKDNYGGQDAGVLGKIITANAITMKNKAQFITIADYESMRKTFDFVHCLPYYDLMTDKFHISVAQMDAIHNKKLVKTGYVEPNRFRTDKFLKRGWSF
jgi:hypothetical protein